jgi:type II secretory pathway predicted ATPase ExeA
MTMQSVLNVLGLTHSDVGRGVNMTGTAVHRLVTHGMWPKRRTAGYHARVTAFLTSKGATPLQLAQLPTLPPPPAPTKAVAQAMALIAAQEKAPVSCEPAEATPDCQDSESPSENPVTPEDLPMLLRNEPLSPDARKHFNLPRSPFVDDVQSSADVFQSPAIRYVRAALMDAANNHGFIAVVGESGAGKSTLLEELEERIKEDKRDIVVIKPYTLAMELNDVKGKTLKSGQIAEAIAHALDPNASLASSPQQRFQQIHDMLKASRRAGRRHLLAMEEAHCLPIATLKHLKRFLELKDGLQRLIGIALVAQPELRDRLGSQNMEVREVMQRCEIVDMPALDNELEAYLRHKFARFDLKYEQVFAPDAADAIRARLIHIPRGGKATDGRSICFPLVVNNLVCRAMNAATRAGWPQVDAQVIAGC